MMFDRSIDSKYNAQLWFIGPNGTDGGLQRMFNVLWSFHPTRIMLMTMDAAGLDPYATALSEAMIVDPDLGDHELKKILEGWAGYES